MTTVSPTPTTSVSPVSAAKPGWQTTEFYVTAVTLVLTLLVATGKISVGDSQEVQANAAKFATIAASVISAGYALGRSIVKGLHLKGH